MRRFHLFEFGDLNWLPGFLRDGITEYLRFVIGLFDLYKPLVPIIRRGLSMSGEKRIIDVGSGGGGGILSIQRHLRELGEDVPVVLTDLHPNLAAFRRVADAGGGRISFVGEPVDATNVPGHLAGFRTMFLSFHHLRPEQARAALADAARHRTAVGIFELYERKVTHLIPLILVPLFVLALTPAVRPFRVSRLVFTYPIPVLPLMIFWDGVVSVLRSYSPGELQAMARSVADPDYRWESGRVKGRGPALTYFIGGPGTDRPGSESGSA